MALIPYDSIRPFEMFRREFDKMWDWPSWVASNFNFSMPMDVYENDKEVIVQCSMPGIEKKEDINIDLRGQTLTVSGKVEKSQEQAITHQHRSERYYGRFDRSITLPHPVKEDHIKASYKNGVLEIHLQKESQEQQRRIDIDFH
jgi:HSP20 family protein